LNPQGIVRRRRRRVGGSGALFHRGSG
jgi:hypothetical protein